MKRNILLFLLFLLIAFVLWKAVFRNPPPESNPPEESPAEATRTPPLTIKSLQAQAVAPQELRPRQESEPEAEAENLPPVDCTSQWDRIATLPLDQALADLMSGALELNQDCLKFENLNDRVNNFYSVCAYDRVQHQLRDETACAAALASYRATWIDRLTADRTDYHAMSLPVLVNKIMARFSNPQLSSEGRAEAIEMIEVLIEREPGFFAARKALVMAFLPELGADSPEALEKLSTAVDNALALNPEDTELQEVELLMAQIQNRPEEINQFVQNNPNSALGYYYRAASSIKSGDRAAGIEDLNRAIQLAPGEERFQATLRKVQQNAQGSHFEIKVGVSFDNL